MDKIKLKTPSWYEWIISPSRKWVYEKGATGKTYCSQVRLRLEQCSIFKDKIIIQSSFHGTEKRYKMTEAGYNSAVQQLNDWLIEIIDELRGEQ